MSIVRYNSSNFLNTLKNEMDRMFDSGFESDNAIMSQWKPSADIKEEADRFLVHADLPGVNPADIKISVDNNTLTIQGERRLESKEEKDGYTHTERFSGTFCRRFMLPANVDSQNITAKSRQGVLELIIPKVEQSTTKYIKVEESD